MEKIKNAAAVLWLSFVRTVVPLIVGSVLGVFTANNIVVDPDLEAVLTGFLTLAFTSVYYLAVRALEVYVAPKFGLLLGSRKSPDGYSKSQPTDVVERKAEKRLAE